MKKTEDAGTLELAIKLRNSLKSSGEYSIEDAVATIKEFNGNYDKAFDEAHKYLHRWDNFFWNLLLFVF